MLEYRRLNSEDITLFKKMDTGITDDYILRIFSRLTEDNNHLYGLFSDGELAVTGGFSIYKTKYAMLGRLRSDIRFRGKNLATNLNHYLIEKAFQIKEISWVGANTQKNNLPAKRVLEKLGLSKLTTIHGAVAEDLTPLLASGNSWNEITNLDKKKKWIKTSLIEKQAIFPFECYYPFPASEELFSDEEVNAWRFYENNQKTRFFILKRDQKKHVYLHMIYPWNDLHKQEGIWETVHTEYNRFVNNIEEETYIWIDLTKEEADNLPEEHPFTLPSPWVLYGLTRESYEA